MNTSCVPIGLRFENVEKRYGNLRALRRVNLRVAPGEALLLAGRNGSGKTTLLRVAAGLIRPSSGTFAVEGADGTRPAARQHAGFVAHQTMIYEELSAEENLQLFARLQGNGSAQSSVEEWLEEAGLAERRESLVRTFSRGMRQRLTIARALLGRPSLLLLDEPGTGLDVEGMAWLVRTLGRLRAAGCTMLMSLHGASELVVLGTRAIRLESGAIVSDSQTGPAVESILNLAGA